MAAVIGGGLGAGAMSAVHLMQTPDDSAAVFAEQWIELHSRCRAAIETSKPLDTDGLSQAASLTRDGLARDLPADQAAWHGADERIVLIDHAPSDANGWFRGCRLELADDSFGVHPDAVGIILTRVLEERSALLAEGTHYVSDPDPITPGFGLGFDAAAPNPDGCLTTTSAFFDQERGIALFTNHERTDLPCRERSQNLQHRTSHA
ncbi:MAG: hypothetical protein AAFV19_19805 [Pseudomonadota bacterium]